MVTPKLFRFSQANINGLANNCGTMSEGAIEIHRLVKNFT